MKRVLLLVLAVLLVLRKDAGMTQDELAAVLKINKHSVSSYERDKSEPPDVIKVAIAKYFGVSVDYLLGVTDDPSPAGHEQKVLRLPSAFPASQMPELKNFIDFLLFKESYLKN